MLSAIAIRRIDGAPGEVYYPLNVISLPEPTPHANEVVVRISAAALNHRDLFIRQHLYPKIGFNIPLLADGCGTVINAGSSEKAQKLLQERVILVPGVGWDESPYGPEDIDKYLIRGGTRSGPTGTLSEMVCVDADEVVLAPKHLSNDEAAALPLAGLTAWRAVYVKALDVVKPGNNILVTGIGGGVALMSLMLAHASGANVYVTSSKEEKLKRAEQLGACGGVSYQDASWDTKLLKMLPPERKWMDAVIDGAGGNLGEKAVNILRPGGVIVSYGMTLGPRICYTMRAVLKNIEIKGSTMGSRKEFREMVAFVESKQIRPIISRVVQGIDDIEALDELFEEMKNGTHFGKLIVSMKKATKSSKM